MIYDSADLIAGYTGGNVTLKRIKSFKPSDELTREPAIFVGSSRPVGSTVKPGAQMIDLENVPDTIEEMPWNDLKASGEQFTFTIQYKAGSTRGRRVQYSVQVAEVTPSPEGDQNGEYTENIKLLVIGKGREL
ncbi:MAG: hypothetical protein M3R63_18590 [Actinomycetota bacterium]|nr:hypothetical protein [Actinomycetota bacterium]